MVKCLLFGTVGGIGVVGASSGTLSCFPGFVRRLSDGVIQAMEVMTPPVGRNIEELIRQIMAFKHVRETGGTEATPAGWRPGDPTLKPRPDLVGKVWEEWKPKE